MVPFYGFQYDDKLSENIGHIMSDSVDKKDMRSSGALENRG